MKKDSLYLHEELMLLALHDEKGTVSAEHTHYALGGAILADLSLMGRLGIDQPGRKAFIELRSHQRVGEPILDECLAMVSATGRRATMATWIGQFAGLSGLTHRVAQGLCERGILRAAEGRFLWLIPRRIYPEIDPTPERQLIQRLETAIFTDAQDVDPRTVALVSLAHATGLLRLVLDRKELKVRKYRIERLISGELTGKATRTAMEKTEAGLCAALAIPVLLSAFIDV